MLALFFAAVLVSHDPLPPVPGVTNPAVTQRNIRTTICRSGWTATIRPSSARTTRLKVQQMVALHLTGSTRDYEEDHLISLQLGGNPTDPSNLWPQRWAGPWNAHDKDRLENWLRRLVCARTITLAAARAEIANDWVSSYRTRLGALPLHPGAPAAPITD
jgi:hypothetical protein